MPKEIMLEQGSDEWKSFRREHVMASDTPMILGVSPYGDALTVYNDKVLFVEKEQNYYMKRGIELEPEARDYLESMIGIELKPKVFVHSEHDWCGASLDAVSEDLKVGGEIKCLSRGKIFKAMEGDIEEYIIYQCQKQMLVMGWSDMYLLFYEDKEINFLTKLYANKEMQNKIFEEESRFYVENLEPKIAPSSKKYLIVEDAGLNSLAEKYIELSKQIDAMEKDKAVLRSAIISYHDGQDIKAGGLLVKRAKGSKNTNWKELIKELEVSKEVVDKFSSFGEDKFVVIIDKPRKTI